MANLLAKTRKITSILQRSVDSLEGDLPYNNMAAQLADIIDCNAAIVNGGGALLGFAMKYKTNNDRVEEFFEAKQLPEEYTRGISRVYDTQENIGIDSDLTIFPVESKDDFPDGLTTIAPIYGGGMRLGSFIIWRNDHDFVDEDLILVEIASTVVGLQLLNLQTENLEETIRKQGAVPATIAIIGGVMKVGLSKEEIELLGREGHNVTKVSRRDLPFVVAAGKNGATTVASTMIIAALAGIKVFATGGIGGVHRGAEHTFDISADLQELANTNVTVVCAGAKSILDLGLTTEYLETFGVPLIGYQTKALPAFFCRTSPFDVSIRLDSAREIARAMAVKWQTGLNGGLVVANPIPEQFAMPEETINAAIDQAVAEAEEQGVIGKESTPFLLARVAELTGGDSLKSNIQLVFNNAILASEIAKEYQRLVG